MDQWKETQMKQLSATTDIQNAYQISLTFAKNTGFKFCAFSTGYLDKITTSSVIQFDNYPGELNAKYKQKVLGALNPIVAHCNQSMFPILWSQELFSEATWIWDALEQHGSQYGWSQSFHDERSGLCSILSLARSHQPITTYELYDNLGFSVFIGRHLHALAVETLPKQVADHEVPHLSEREIDVLKLAAAGKTAGESAKILNVTPRTVNFHVQSAIMKFGVNNKISAVIAAAKVGILTNTLGR